MVTKSGQNKWMMTDEDCVEGTNTTNISASPPKEERKTWKVARDAPQRLALGVRRENLSLIKRII